MEETPAQIVKSARKARGLTEGQLGKAVGTTQQTICDIESGKTRRSKFFLPIALFLGIPPRKLIPAEPKVESLQNAEISLAEQPHVRVRLFSMAAIQENVRKGRGLTVNSDDYIYAPVPADGAHFAVRIVGSSLNRRYMAGSHVIIDPEFRELIDGACYLFMAGGKAALKVYDKAAGALVPDSTDPTYDSTPLNDDVHILGGVVASWRNDDPRT